MSGGYEKIYPHARYRAHATGKIGCLNTVLILHTPYCVRVVEESIHSLITEYSDYEANT